MKLLSLLLALTLPVATMANHADHRWTLGLGAGFSFPLNNEFVKDNTEGDISGSVWGRYNITERWGLQLGYDRVELNGKDLGEGYNTTSLENINLMVTLNFGHLGPITPYAGVGVGYGIMSRTPLWDVSGSEKRFQELTPKVRLGFDYGINHNMALGLTVDWHYFQTENDELVGSPINNAQVLVPMLSFAYSFGERNSAPADSDKDGVNDKNDSCPNTPAGTSVDSSGCPVKKMSDSDGDGVADADDRCSGTPAGKTVNAYGCAAKEVFEVKLDVKFDSGKTNIKPEFDAQLSEVAEFMKKYPKTTAVIEGHTDSYGKRSSNMWFSKTRAKNVKKYLTSKFGIDASRLTSKGYGPDKPIGSNKTAEGRAKNRRVVAVIKTEK